MFSFKSFAKREGVESHQILEDAELAKGEKMIAMQGFAMAPGLHYGMTQNDV